MYVYDDAKVSASEQKTTTESKFVIVMEPGLKNGDAVLKDPSLSAKKKVQFLLDVAKGLEHIHDAGFVHNDVKADNFLLFEGDIGKVSDFGRPGRIGDTDANDNVLEINEDIQNFIKLIRDTLPTILRTHYRNDWYDVYRPVESLSRNAVPSTMTPIISLLDTIVKQFKDTNPVHAG
jgi:serine/threonine protein kinase